MGGQGPPILPALVLGGIAAERERMPQLKKEAKMPTGLTAAIYSGRVELLVPWWTHELVEPTPDWSREDQVDTIAVLAARVIEQQQEIKGLQDKIVSIVRILEKLDESMSTVNRDLDKLSQAARNARGSVARVVPYDEEYDDE